MYIFSLKSNYKDSQVKIGEHNKINLQQVRESFYPSSSRFHLNRILKEFYVIKYVARGGNLNSP